MSVDGGEIEVAKDSQAKSVMGASEVAKQGASDVTNKEVWKREGKKEQKIDVDKREQCCSLISEYAGREREMG